MNSALRQNIVFFYGGTFCFMVHIKGNEVTRVVKPKYEMEFSNVITLFNLKNSASRWSDFLYPNASAFKRRKNHTKFTFNAKMALSGYYYKLVRCILHTEEWETLCIVSGSVSFQVAVRELVKTARLHIEGGNNLAK